MTGGMQQAGMSADAMRAEADQINASVREENRALLERSRRARQLEWEADLTDKAAGAKAALDKADALLPGLDAAVTAALGAKREAEDRRDADQARLDRRRADLLKAEADNAPAAEQEELAARVHQLARAAAASENAVSKPASDYEAAKAARASQKAQVSALYAAWAEAARAAENPGTAPGMPAIAPGLGRISDLDEEAQRLIRLQVLLLAGLAGSAGTPRPGRTPTR